MINLRKRRSQNLSPNPSPGRGGEHSPPPFAGKSAGGLGFFFLTALVVGCDLPGQPKPADRPVPAEQVKDFDTLYTTRCAGCHGADGKLGPAPPLNDPIFLAIASDRDIVRVITEGRAVSAEQKTPMPAFGLGKGTALTAEQDKMLAELREETHAAPKQKSPLTIAQIDALAQGIRKRWGPPASVAPDLTAAGTGGGDKTKGREVFRQACAGCHGDEGKGGKHGAINDPAFLALISDQQLRRYAITGRPDLGMPAYDGKEGRAADFTPLTAKKIDDLVALLACWRKGDAGCGK